MKENEGQLASPVKEECLVNSDPLDQEAKMDLKDHPVGPESLVHLGQVGRSERLVKVVLPVPQVYQVMLVGQERQERKGHLVLMDLKEKREFLAPLDCLAFQVKEVYLVCL